MARYAVVLVLCLLGCASDSRVRRQGNENLLKLKAAQVDMDNAPTPQEKVDVAKQYFKTAMPGLLIVQDYLEDRPPTIIPATTNPPAPAQPAPVTQP